MQRVADVRPFDRAQPRCQHRLRGAERRDSDCTRRLRSTRQWPVDVQREHGVDVGVMQCRRHRRRKERGRRVAPHVDGIRRRHMSGQYPRQRGLRFRREHGQWDTAIGSRVGGHRARAAPIGDDGEPIAARNPAHRENPRGSKELRVGDCAHRSGALHRRVEHSIGRWRIEPDRIALPRSAASQHNHRLGPRSGPQRGHEPARIAHRLDVQQDAVGRRIVDERIEHVAESDVVRGSQRKNGRKADAQWRGETEHRRADRSRLSDERKPPRTRSNRSNRRIEPDVGADHTERVRSEDPNSSLARRRRDSAQKAMGFAFVERRRRVEDRGLDARMRAIVEDGGDGRTRRCDQRKLDGLADVAERDEAPLAEYALAPRVDEVELARKAAREQILDQHATHRSRAVRRAHHGDRGRHEQRTEIVLQRRHGAGQRRMRDSGTRTAICVASTVGAREPALHRARTGGVSLRSILARNNANARNWRSEALRTRRRRIYFSIRDREPGPVAQMVRAEDS